MAIVVASVKTKHSWLEAENGQVRQRQTDADMALAENIKGRQRGI
jgi:hypothetical protein